MLVLFDIGNTHTHLGFVESEVVERQTEIPTQSWLSGGAQASLEHALEGQQVKGACLCSVVPSVTASVKRLMKSDWGIDCHEINHRTVKGVSIEYPNPNSIGPDRLANAVAAKHHFGAPVVVVDFGTAVTFDVVDQTGAYIGGIIAPGLAAMTSYLHEKTALLPCIEIREPESSIGKSTEEAMLIGAVTGYRGMVSELIRRLKQELHTDKLAVVATGGYAEIISAALPEIDTVDPLLTLEGLNLEWNMLL
jgi:type III pantothenate kinase